MPPPIVLVIFVAVLGTFLGGYLLFTRFFSKRDSGKLKDRLLERVPTQGPNAAAQPLFRVNESDQQKLIYRLLAGLKLDQRLSARGDVATVFMVPRPRALPGLAQHIDQVRLLPMLATHGG